MQDEDNKEPRAELI